MTRSENERLAAVETEIAFARSDIKDIKDQLAPVIEYVIADRAANEARKEYIMASRKYVAACVGIASGVISAVIAVLTFVTH